MVKKKVEKKSSLFGNIILLLLIGFFIFLFVRALSQRNTKEIIKEKLINNTKDCELPIVMNDTLLFNGTEIPKCEMVINKNYKAIPSEKEGEAGSWILTNETENCIIPVEYNTNGYCRYDFLINQTIVYSHGGREIDRIEGNPYNCLEVRHLVIKEEN